MVTAALPQSLVIYDMELSRVLTQLGMPAAEVARFDKVPLRYELQLSRPAFDTLQKHPVLKEEIRLAMYGIGKTMVETRIKPFMLRNQPWNATFRTRVEQALRAGETQVNQLVGDALERHGKTNEAWKSYYKTQRKELVFAAIGLGTAAVGVGLAVPTGGASIAVAVIAGSRALLTGAKKLAECARTAEQCEQRLNESIQRMKRAYDRTLGGSKSLGRFTSIGGQVAKATGVMDPVLIFKGDVTPSIGSIRSELAIYRGKLGNLYATANIMAVQLYDLLDKAEQLRREYGAVPGSTFDPTKTEAYPALAGLERTIDELLQSGTRQIKRGFTSKLTIGDAYARYRNGWSKADMLKATVESNLLNLEPNEKAVERIGKVLALLTNLGFALVNYNEALKIPAKLADPAVLDATRDIYLQGFGLLRDAETVLTAQQIAGTSVAYAGDVIGIGKEAVELCAEFGVDPADPALASLTASLSAIYHAPLPAATPPPPAPPPIAGRRVLRPTPPTGARTAATGPGAAAAPLRPPPPRPPRPLRRP